MTAEEQLRKTIGQAARALYDGGWLDVHESEINDVAEIVAWVFSEAGLLPVKDGD